MRKKKGFCDTVLFKCLYQVSGHIIFVCYGYRFCLFLRFFNWILEFFLVWYFLVIFFIVFVFDHIQLKIIIAFDNLLQIKHYFSLNLKQVPNYDFMEILVENTILTGSLPFQSYPSANFQLWYQISQNSKSLIKTWLKKSEGCFIFLVS
jgi:hypothetical protein